MDFQPFQKIPRLMRDIVITEKIDGTNGIIAIGENGEFQVGSRNRWITPQNDNAGFAGWCYANKEELMKLGVGYHYGEWWGQGIQRRYGLAEKRFSLFNVSRWEDDAVRPSCCHVVPVLYRGMFNLDVVAASLNFLIEHGSLAAKGFMNPEGIIVYHPHGNHLYKVTLGDDGHKGS